MTVPPAMSESATATGVCVDAAVLVSTSPAATAITASPLPTPAAQATPSTYPPTQTRITSPAPVDASRATPIAAPFTAPRTSAKAPASVAAAAVANATTSPAAIAAPVVLVGSSTIVELEPVTTATSRGGLP